MSVSTDALCCCRRNSKLDSFLKRNTERGVYERIRAYEPCVVVSEAVSKVYMHVVLSDERVYLAEYPPRTVTEVLSFSQIRDIELVSSQSHPYNNPSVLPPCTNRTVV